jgi:hypothetical protein
MSADSTLSLVEAATRLLSEAKDNGGGLELQDVFGPATEHWTSAEQIMAPVRAHHALQWCLRFSPKLEMRQDETLVPPVWFLLTTAREALVTLRETPAELTTGAGMA